MACRPTHSTVAREIIVERRSLSMQALVTTSRSVLLLDSDSGAWRPIHRGMGLYYGICRHQGAIWVAARRRGVNDGSGPGEDRGCLVRFAPPGPPEVREYDRPLLDLHGIASVNGAIWCTCSFDNAIAVLEGGDSCLRYPWGRPEEPPYDRNHLNTLVEVADGVLALAHNWGESEVALLDRNTMAILRIWRMGVEAHNIWFDGDALRVCSSKEGMLVGEDGLRVRVGGISPRLCQRRQNPTRWDHDPCSKRGARPNDEFYQAARPRLQRTLRNPHARRRHGSRHHASIES